MTTAPGTLVKLQAKMVKNLGTRNLGIVGDDSHVRTGGYHIGASSLRRAGMSGDYSLHYRRDYIVTHDYSCAIDIGGSAALLMKLGTRLVHALKAHDPRVYGRVRATNAPYDGVSIDRRVDDEGPTTSADDNVQSSSDRGHIHVEFYRSLVLNQNVMDGFYEVMAGVPLSKSVAHPSPKPTPKPVKKPSAPVHKTVTIRRGDTLTSIAARNKVKGGWKTLQKLNNLKNPNKISIGQKLRIN